MTSSPRTRVGRLAQSLGKPAAQRSGPRGRRTKPCPSSLSRAFDSGEPVALYADTDPTYANDVDPTQARPSLSAAPEPSAAYLAAVPTATSPAPAAAAPAATSPAPLGVLAAENPVAAAPAAVAPAAENGSFGARLDDKSAAAPAGSTAELAGWTVPQAADSNDQAFAEDIQAILAHAQSVSATGRVALPDVPSPPPVPPPPAVAHGIGVGATHDIFKQMAAANAPSTFNQGPVALTVDFDRLDRALEEGQPAGGALAQPYYDGGG